MQTKRQEDIFGIILQNEPIGISGIVKKMAAVISIATLNRELVKLKETDFLPVVRCPHRPRLLL